MARPLSIVVTVLPVMAPGFMVQFPDGKLVNTTDPVATVQLGWVIIPTVGACGVSGGALITIFTEASDVHPAALATVKEYVPVAIPVIVVDVVLPVMTPGLIVQLPAGKLAKTTDPVATVQVGWVIIPTVGASGIGLTAMVNVVVVAH